MNNIKKNFILNSLYKIESIEKRNSININKIYTLGSILYKLNTSSLDLIQKDLGINLDNLKIKICLFYFLIFSNIPFFRITLKNKEKVDFYLSNTINTQLISVNLIYLLNPQKQCSSFKFSLKIKHLIEENASFFEYLKIDIYNEDTAFDCLLNYSIIK